MADNAEHNPFSSPTSISLTRADKEPVYLMVSGSEWGIRVMIHTLFKRGVASVDAWSKPQQMPNSDKLMSITTKHIQKPDILS
ncbi:MAG: hypothetical protein AAF572_00850 [Cyanobacteria bacterium P01_B01_bin.77]